MIRTLATMAALLFPVLVSANTVTYSHICSADLNQELSALPEFLTEVRSSNENDLPMECITNAMETFYGWTLSVRDERKLKNLPEIGHYTYCASNTEVKPLRSHRPPCQTSQYTNTIKNSYNDVLQCLDIDPKAIFPITAVESGFHINSVSLTNDDIGLGQITPIAIEDVNFEWETAVEAVTSSSKDSCRRISPLVAQLKKSENPESYTCSITKLPENPIKNLLYLALLHKKNEFYIDQYFSIYKVVESIESLTKVKLDEKQISSLKNMLVALSYNVGAQGSTELFTEFLQMKYRPIESLQIKIDEYKATQVELYLSYKTLQSQNELTSADRLLATRNANGAQMEQLQEKLENYQVSMGVFNIDGKLGGFESFLTNQKNVFYLSILKDRIRYVEDILIKQPGRCSVPDYLNEFESM